MPMDIRESNMSSKASNAKASMKCGEKRKSFKKQKKTMKKVCEGDSEKLIHAGDSRYSSNQTAEQRRNYRKRHNCESADPNTPRGLACEELWSAGGKKHRGTSAQKRSRAKTGRRKNR